MAGRGGGANVLERSGEGETWNQGEGWDLGWSVDVLVHPVPGFLQRTHPLGVRGLLWSGSGEREGAARGPQDTEASIGHVRALCGAPLEPIQGPSGAVGGPV